jgi:hypothetical protein
MFIVPTANGAINLVDPKKGTIDWSYVITPLADAVAANPNAAGNGNMPGGGGVPGGGGGGFGGGLGGGGQTTTTNEKPLWVQAAGPATIAGNTLLISAKDGSILAFDRDLGVDLTPPTVKLLFPNSGDQVSGQPPLVLVFKIDDEASGVKPSTISIEIDGEKYVSKREKDGNYSVRFSQTGENKLLSDGRKVITVTVSDWLQNQRVAKFALTIDNSLRPIILPGTANPNGLPGGNGGLGGGAGGKGGGEGGGGG